MILVQSFEKNAFLARLSASDLALLWTHLASYELRVGEYLHKSEDKIDEVIFPRSGLVSLGVPVCDGHGAAIIVGREGIIGGYAAAAAAPATCNANVCIGGAALSMSARAFRDGAKPFNPPARRSVRRRLARTGPPGCALQRCPFRRGSNLPTAS